MLGERGAFSEKRVMILGKFQKDCVTSPPTEKKQVACVLKFEFLKGAKTMYFWLHLAFPGQFPVARSPQARLSSSWNCRSQD